MNHSGIIHHYVSLGGKSTSLENKGAAAQVEGELSNTTIKFHKYSEYTLNTKTQNKTEGLVQSSFKGFQAQVPGN